MARRERPRPPALSVCPPLFRLTRPLSDEEADRAPCPELAELQNVVSQNKQVLTWLTCPGHNGRNEDHGMIRVVKGVR